MEINNINFISYDEFVLLEQNFDDVIIQFVKSRKNANTKDVDILKKLHQIRTQMINYKFKFLI